MEYVAERGSYNDLLLDLGISRPDRAGTPIQKIAEIEGITVAAANPAATRAALIR